MAAKSKSAAPDPGLGHNSEAETKITQIGGIAAEALRQFIARIERLDEEAKALNDDRKDVYSQIKSQGFDVKAVKKLIAIRRRDSSEIEEEAQILNLYAAAIGMQLPLAL